MVLPTLSEFYKSEFLPLWIEGQNLDPKTKMSYQESIGWWSKLTGDPRLDLITDHVVANFISEMCKQRGKKPGSTMKLTSVQKTVRQIDTVLKMTGPRSRINRYGKGLLVDPPFLVSPRPDQEPPGKDWTIAEVRALYGACDCMTEPAVSGVPAADWWRALICLGYFSGLRIKAMLHVEYSMVHGQWLTVPAKLSKRRKGKKQYLHPEALEHIERIKRPGREVILQFPEWEKKRRSAYALMEQLEEAAGIDQNRRWRFQSLRKTHLTILASLSLDFDEGMRTAQQSAGHSSLSITTSHYISGSLQDRLIAAAIDRMPSPIPPEDRHRSTESKRPEPEPLRQPTRSYRHDDFID